MTTPWHPTDEDLILLFYGETDPVIARRLHEHLNGCAACRASWTELGDTLKLVDQASLPEPAAGFEGTMWERVQRALPAPLPEPVPVPRKSNSWLRTMLPIAATLTITTLAGAYAWREWHRPVVAPKSTPPTTTVAATTTKPDSKLAERVLLGAIDEHLQQAQMLLIELKNSPEGEGDFEFERSAADELISAGRLYRVAARQRGERQIAQMLDDLESVLVDVARSERSVRPEALKALRARMESQDLLFKVRVATKEVHERRRDLLTAAANE